MLLPGGPLWPGYPPNVIPVHREDAAAELASLPYAGKTCTIGWQMRILVLLGWLALIAGGCNAQPEPIDLRSAERKVYSQFGEDGVIEKLFERITPTRKYCVEFGASDGIRGSNVRKLIVDEGWSGLQIEGDPLRAKRLFENYRAYPRAKTLHAWVWPGNVEILFEENGVPEDLDFLVIDIDSNDYYVWRAIHQFRPKVVMIEVNSMFAPPKKAVIDFHPMNYWDGNCLRGRKPAVPL